MKIFSGMSTTHSSSNENQCWVIQIWSVWTCLQFIHRLHKTVYFYVWLSIMTRFDSSLQGTWTTCGNLTTSFTLCTAWRDYATSRSKPVWIRLFCVQSLIKSWISSYIIYMSQENKQVCIIGIILIISEKETADKVCHSAKHRHFNNAVLTKGWKLQCNTCSHFVAMQTHDNGSNMFHYLDISSS